ncbi:MAG: DUF305 domain-containing protein [Gemmatimonadota bacterium]
MSSRLPSTPDRPADRRRALEPTVAPARRQSAGFPPRAFPLVACLLGAGLPGIGLPGGGLFGPAPAHAQESGPSRPAARSKADIEALYAARQDSARRLFTAADVDFMTGMISHHAQALIMSGLAPTHGAGPAVRTLTARIINAQRDEIVLMQGWLEDRGQPVPEVRIDGLDLTIDTGGHARHAPLMPGMLSRDQLEELDGAAGPEFDRLFLTYMIEHHAGAVTMVHDLFATDGAARDAFVFKLASDIQVDQTTEIARMERLLTTLPASGAGSDER